MLMEKYFLSWPRIQIKLIKFSRCFSYCTVYQTRCSKMALQSSRKNLGQRAFKSGLTNKDKTELYPRLSRDCTYRTPTMTFDIKGASLRGANSRSDTSVFRWAQVCGCDRLCTSSRSTTFDRSSNVNSVIRPRTKPSL